MSDVFSKAERSEVMSRIRSRGNKATELALATFFRRHKITGWRRQIVVQSPRSKVQSQETGSESFRVRPDFVFPKRKLAVFVDGCFWHGCPQHGTRPRNNRAFWRRKFSRNKKRDALVTRALRRANWRVVRIWEHELKRNGAARLWRRIRRHVV